MVLPWLAVIGAGAAGYFLRGQSPTTTNSPETRSTQSLRQSPPTQNQQPVTIQYQSPPNAPTKTQNLVVATGTALVVVCYYYYSSSRQTKIITNTVVETAGETQDIVRECDENNERRIEVLDKKNQERKNELSAEIRSESRTQFKVISDQLKLLANVSLETLKQVANGMVRGDDNELSTDQDHACDLLDVVNEYRNESEINLSTESYLQAHGEYLLEVQQEISQREENKNKNNNNNKQRFDKTNPINVTEMVTPGGPHYNTPGGPDDNSQNIHDKSFISNVTDMFSGKNTKSNDDSSSYSDWILRKVGGTPYKYYSNTRDFYKKHDQTIILAGIAVGSFYGFSKLSTYIWPKEDKNNNTQIITLQS